MEDEGNADNANQTAGQDILIHKSLTFCEKCWEVLLQRELEKGMQRFLVGSRKDAVSDNI